MAGFILEQFKNSETEMLSLIGKYRVNYSTLDALRDPNAVCPISLERFDANDLVFVLLNSETKKPTGIYKAESLVKWLISKNKTPTDPITGQVPLFLEPKTKDLVLQEEEKI